MAWPSYLVTTLAADTQGSMAATSAASTQRSSVEVENVDDEGHHPRNVSPVNASRILESSDGSDDEGPEGNRKAAKALSIININDNSSDEEPVPKESDKAERGMIQSHQSIGNMLMLTQIAS